jgi:crotonobetainyl-CoA:carnitine CoA-transferase CaiB-like acyl-CoA transferase
MNSGKLSMALDLSHPKGPEVVKRLVTWSDVVIESFIPGTMARWGLGYENIRQMKPEIIMLSASMQGQKGPHAAQRGFGTTLTALVGFSNLVGWPDRSPVTLANAYTDYITCWYGAIAILGALEWRRRTGEGMYIDLSQFESGVSFLAAATLDYSANQRVQSATGNRSPYAAPHGAYRCRGDDRWCVIAVFTDEEWQAFGQVIGEPEWCRDPRFDTLLGRKGNEEELDKLVEEWTSQYSAEEVMEMMQAAGVAAGVVANGRDLHEDPQLGHRHHFWPLEHPEMGVTNYETVSFRLSETPPEVRIPAPCLGEHTEYVCREILGMSEPEFDQLTVDGVFQ